MKLLISTLVLTALPLAGLACTGSTSDEAPVADVGEEELGGGYDIPKSERLLKEAVDLAEIRALGYAAVCDNGAYVQTIIDKLREAVKVRDTVYFRTRVIAKREILNQQVGRSLAYKEIIGMLSEKNGKLVGLEKSLSQGVTFHQPGEGAWGSLERVDFEPGGKAVIHTGTVDWDKNTVTWNAKVTSWSLDASAQIVVDGKRYTLDRAAGDFAIFTTPQPDYRSYYSSPVECDA